MLCYIFGHRCWAISQFLSSNLYTDSQTFTLIHTRQCKFCNILVPPFALITWRPKWSPVTQLSYHVYYIMLWYFNIIYWGGGGEVQLLEEILLCPLVIKLARIIPNKANGICSSVCTSLLSALTNMLKHFCELKKYPNVYFINWNF